MVETKTPAPRLPQRTCVGCRSTTDKSALLRVVRTREGAVVVDSSGRAPGRGGYLCPRPPCWTAALQGDRLGVALRTTLNETDRRRLRDYALRLAADGNGAADDN